METLNNKPYFYSGKLCIPPFLFDRYFSRYKNKNTRATSKRREEGMLVSSSNTNNTGVKKSIITIATTTTTNIRTRRRRGTFWTRRSARVAAVSFEDKYIYKNRDGKETERDGLAISPFAGGDERRTRRVFEIELPSRDIGIEFRDGERMSIHRDGGENAEGVREVKERDVLRGNANPRKSTRNATNDDFRSDWVEIYAGWFERRRVDRRCRGMPPR